MFDNTGGPAFPVLLDNYKMGMTLRDYFAAKAMQGILAEDRSAELPSVALADWAYVLADAMIEARMK